MKNLLKATIFVLDEVLLVLLILYILWETGVDITPPLIITVVVLAVPVIFIVYKIIVSLSKIKQVGAREGLIGLQGRVVSSLTPEGVIRVHGELWKAMCIDDSIITNEDVVVVSIEGLKLIVKRKDDARIQPQV